VSQRPDLYKEAGVDVDKGDRLVEWLQGGKAPTATRYGATVSGIGGFAALFRPNFKGMTDPLLISSTDGVGTKVLLGIQTGKLKGLGLDLVAMCVNDLYTIGGRPLFFLDYYATGALDEAQFKDVLTGIKTGCAQSGALLLGGETAEMPGLYQRGHFDLAGFVVGVVDGETMLGPSRVKAGDRLYALPSSGFHSNGFSLLRKWAEGETDQGVLDRLMTPTRIYHEIPELVDTLGSGTFHALANITGGGISGNLPRVIPAHLACHIELGAVPTPAWMRAFLESKGTTVRAQEAVFNGGCGMIAVVAREGAAKFETAAKAAQLDVTPIGDVKDGAAGAGEATVHFH
jgi:phosphoribosylformylglycinamidine cyclo-ligase